MKKCKGLYLLSIISVLLFSSFSHAGLVVIVNPGNANQLDQGAVKRIFLGKQAEYPDGSEAVPYGQEDESAIVEEFNNKVLERSANQMKAYWSKLIFTGKGSPPEKLANDAAVVSKVAGDAKAIGFVDSQSVNDSVKVVLSF